MSDELLPCPYCGSAPELHDYSLSAVVCCPTCGVSARWAHGGGDHARRAIAAWNRRVPQAGSVPVEVSEAMRLVLRRLLHSDLSNHENAKLYDIVTNWLDSQRPSQGQEAANV